MFIIVIVGLFITGIFAQSYEPMFNRADITGLTGGTVTDLDGIATTGLAEGTNVIINDGAESRIYRLTAWTAEVETPPNIILPDDFGAGNQKVWIIIISSDPSETGFSGSGVPSQTLIALPDSTPRAGYTYTGYADELSGNDWTIKTNMTAPRAGMAVVTANGKIYAIGGVSGITYLNTTWEYDPIVDSWAAKAVMPTARAYFGATVVDGKIYCIGGYNGSYLATNEEYDPVANSWATKTAMPAARGFLGAATANGKVYCIGGYNSGYKTTNEEYDPVANSWAAKTAMPTARGYLAVAEANGKIYCIGGDDGSSLNDNEEYDPIANSWAVKTPMITARRSLASTSVNGKIYAIGGCCSYLDTNEEYDPGSNSWRAVPSMPTERSDLGVAVFDSKIYCIGGEEAGADPVDYNECYQPGIVLYWFQKD